MVAILALMREIRCWREASEDLEIMNTVRLVKVAAGQGHARPIDLLPASDQMQHLLKAAHSAKEFGRQPNLVTKHLDKAP